MRARGIHGLRPAVLLAMAAIILLYPWGTLEAGASPAPPPGPPAVDPSGGLLPDQASDRAVEVIGEKLVSRGGR